MVTDKSVRYQGSMGIDRNLLEASGIEAYECVDVVNLNTGARWTTYALPVDEEGACSLNGGAARLGEIGDCCIVMTYGLSTQFQGTTVVHCDGTSKNSISKTFQYCQQDLRNSESHH